MCRHQSYYNTGIDQDSECSSAGKTIAYKVSNKPERFKNAHGGNGDSIGTYFG